VAGVAARGCGARWCGGGDGGGMATGSLKVAIGSGRGLDLKI